MGQEAKPEAPAEASRMRGAIAGPSKARNSREIKYGAGTGRQVRTLETLLNQSLIKLLHLAM
jgi:hypothetical protein